jgi:hypothetical protein
VIPDPFDALGLPARPDLDDEAVRAAWRAIAADTHPDRPDGGDLARYTAASAAYAELRTPWGRSEAYADLPQQADLDAEPATGPLPPIPAYDPRADGLPRHPLAAVLEFPARVRHGRPGHLLLRAVITAALALVVLQLIPGTTAAPADITGLITWFALTGRRDLAPPPER